MTKAVCESILLLLILLALYFLSEGPAVCEEPDLGYIIEKVKARQLKILAEVGDSVCLAESRYREMKRDGDLKKEVLTRKRIYMKGKDRRYDEYLYMSINGKVLNAKRLKKKAEKANKDQQEIKLPLTPDGDGAYDFSLAGSDVCNGMDVWLIDFRAKEKKDEYVNGRGCVSKDTFDMIRVKLVPAKLSRLIKDLDVSVTFDLVHGYWMPVKLEVDAVVGLSFLFYRRITIEETYSEYRFNNQLEDSIFELE